MPPAIPDSNSLPILHRELLALLPLYILGNLHCIGMCGPIVAFLSRHR